MPYIISNLNLIKKIVNIHHEGLLATLIFSKSHKNLSDGLPTFLFTRQKGRHKTPCNHREKFFSFYLKTQTASIRNDVYPSYRESGNTQRKNPFNVKRNNPLRKMQGLLNFKLCNYNLKLCNFTL
jgi:hypothetical protein